MRAVETVIHRIAIFSRWRGAADLDQLGLETAAVRTGVVVL
jgi:hypothetical protein